MSYILFVLVGVMVYIALSYRKPYSRLFYLVFLAFLLVICSHLFESLANAFTDIEFQTTGILYDPYNELQFALGNIRFGYTEVYALNGVGNALFFMTIPMIIRVYRLKGRFCSPWEAVRKLAPYALIPVCNAVFYSPLFSRYLFDYYQKSNEYLKAVRTLVSIEIALNAALVGCVVYAMGKLFLYYLKSRSIWVRNKTRATFICLLALCASFFYIYYATSIKFYFKSSSVPRTLISNAISAQPMMTYDSIPALMVLALMMLVFAVQVRFKFITLPGRLQAILHPVDGYLFNNRLQMVLHSLKNAVFSQQILIDKVLSTNNLQEQTAALYNLDGVTKKAMAEITHYLDLSRNTTYQSSAAHVEDCVHRAWAMATPPENVSLQVRSPGGLGMVRFSSRDLVEVFTNLLNNSFSAIEQAGREKGVIMVELFEEQSQIIVHFHDNGTGMDRKTRRKIFDSYFSTKNTGKNWGLGLTFVKNTVRIQRGEVFVKSRPGEGTMFELVLPLVEEGLYGKY